MSLGATLVEHAGTRTLIDLGWGPESFDISAATNGARGGYVRSGEMIDNLGMLGLVPADIDVVALTHLHRDHIGWLIGEGGGPRFRNARHHLSLDEWSHWNSQAAAHWGGPAPQQLQLLGELMTPLEDGSVVTPGVTAVETAGHTPGHFSFLLTGGSGRAIVLGDTVHCPIELEHPDLRLAADLDSEAAHTVRGRLRRELLRSDTLSIGTHFPERVFGRLVAVDGRLRVRSVS
jgi:glyoxylase-like metal-dependent hydrolase (beta-lactamase superfamily II)